MVSHGDQPDPSEEGLEYQLLLRFSTTKKSRPLEDYVRGSVERANA